MLQQQSLFIIARSDPPPCCAPRSADAAAASMVDGSDPEESALEGAAVMNSSDHTWLERYPKSEPSQSACPLAPEDVSLHLQELGLEVEFVRSLGPWAVAAAAARWPNRESVTSEAERILPA